MVVFTGPIWKDGIEEEGSVRVERGRLLERLDHVRPGGTPAVILDGLHNFHTHVGDAVLRGRPLPRSLAALVAPGTGLKHRVLASTAPARLAAATRRALVRYWQAGTRSLVDFREQGVDGIQWVRRASRDAEPRIPALRLLGRPSGGSADDLGRVLQVADGIGLPSLTDVGQDAVAEVARACRRAQRPLALHASEGRREPMEALLAFKPNLLVHLCRATRDDLRRVQDADVPVATCPSSNRFFGQPVPVAALWRAGVRFHFGTDNAMLGYDDLLHEARVARRAARGLPDRFLLEALTTPPWKVIKRLAPVSDSVGAPHRVLILPRRGTRVGWDAPPRLVTR